MLRSEDDIRMRIVRRRCERINSQGHEFGHSVPQKRQYPLVSFLDGPGVICEIKRASPSRGSIADSLDPVAQAGKYYQAGVRSVSVLTEEDFFSGYLSDLIEVKKAYPELALLRKDFLVDREDIDVSYRAGADAVLLIASLMSVETLNDLYAYALSRGMQVLFEVHDEEDVRKACAVKPDIVGINCRNLKTFATDLVHPLHVKTMLDTAGTGYRHLVFESGIQVREDADFAFDSGFSAVLVGEAVVRDPDLAGELVAAAQKDRTTCSRFWARLYAGRKIPGDSAWPLVKVCGLCRKEDVLLADELGADILGFIFAPSPRRTQAGFLRSVGRTRALKVAVVVCNNGEGLPAEVRELLEEGHIDAVQLHGEIAHAEGFPYYCVARPESADDIDMLKRTGSPRVLVDAFSKDAYGGTGKRIEAGLVRKAAAIQPLWLAGGLNPENIAGIVEMYRPELVDVSSGLESAPGIKDHAKIRAFFKALGR